MYLHVEELSPVRTVSYLLSSHNIVVNVSMAQWHPDNCSAAILTLLQPRVDAVRSGAVLCASNVNIVLVCAR